MVGGDFRFGGHKRILSGARVTGGLHQTTHERAYYKAMRELQSLRKEKLKR